MDTAMHVSSSGGLLALRPSDSDIQLTNDLRL